MGKSKKKRRRELIKNTCGTLFVLTFLSILYAQAIIKIMKGDLAGGTNYYGQPVGAYLQLVMAIFFTIFAGIMAWQHLRGAKKKRKGGSEPEWMNTPPFRWPWN